MYEEAAPPGRLRDVARCVWRSASESPKRIVPDGCVDLVAGDGEVFVAGPDTAAWSSVTSPGAVLSGVRFLPGRAAGVLGVAADELRDRRVPLGELWGRAGESLAERLLAGELSPAQVVGSRLGEVPPADPAVAELIARLDAGVARVSEAATGLIAGAADGLVGRTDAAAAPVSEAAAELIARPNASAARVSDAAAEPTRPRTAGPSGAGSLEAQFDQSGDDAALITAPLLGRPVIAGVSERGLRRRFVQAVGYGPATYLRVSRFQRAVALARHVSGLAALAAAAGYADQAHLSRDCRALTGLTPRRYFR